MFRKAQAFAACLIAVAAGTGGSPSAAQEKVTYLFPAPPMLPAFGPIRLAQSKGYFKAEGLDVDFQVGKGGVDGRSKSVPATRRLAAGSATGRFWCGRREFRSRPWR